MDGGLASRAAVELTRSGRFVFQLAFREDEADLRALVRDTPVGGAIETTLRREPNYFDGATVEGPLHQVLAVREGAGGPIVGMATRSVRLRFVDGQPTPVGYLGGLRLRPDIRKGLVLARGFQALRTLHADGQTDFYLTTVTEGNVAAIESLTPGRAGLPHYHPLGRYLTYMLPAKSLFSSRMDRTLRVRTLTASDLPELVNFLNAQGRSRLFFPCLSETDFCGADATYRDLAPEQIVGAWRGGRLVGCLAAWDQSRYKQSVVERYHGVWKWSRHVYNGFARFARWPCFPAPGGQLRHVTLALPVVGEGDDAVWWSLLAAVRDLPVVRRSECLALGLFERDPLVPLARRSAIYCYVTRLFVVSWDSSRVQPQRFDGRNVCLELGCL